MDAEALLETTLLDHRALVAAAHDLAPLSPTLVKISVLIATHNYSAAEVEAIVRLDGPLTGRLLQFANSAASATHIPIGTVREAVFRVGVGPVLSFIAGTTVRQTLVGAVPAYGLSEGDLWRHSVAAALACEVIAQKAHAEVPPESFTASLLHDIGKVVLARFLDPLRQRLLAKARERDGASSMRAEMEVLGINHGELGGLVAQHWKLPERVEMAIAHHHAPEAVNDVICDVVHLANVLAKRAGTGYVATSSDLDADPGSLNRLGIESRRLSPILDIVTARLADTLTQFG